MIIFVFYWLFICTTSTVTSRRDLSCIILVIERCYGLFVVARSSSVKEKMNGLVIIINEFLKCIQNV